MPPRPANPAPVAAAAATIMAIMAMTRPDEDPLAKVSLEFQARALALTLEREFPGRVQVEYLNVLQDPRGPDLPQTALLCSLTYPTPLVYINGQGRFAGALPVERIREEVAKILAAA